MINSIKYTKRIFCFVNPFSSAKYEWSRKSFGNQIHKVKTSDKFSSLLWDIKKYLQKLESGQMEIEASQRELHKDLTNVKFSIEEVRKLKADVEDVKMTNAEAMELIRCIQKKLKSHEAQLAEKLSEVTQATGEKIYTETSEPENSDSEDCAKRKRRKILSEEILEITSNVKPKNRSEKGSEYSVKSLAEKESSQENKREKFKHSAKFRKKTPKPDSQRKIRTVKLKKKKHRRNRKADNGIMERYLKDSAKYNKWSSSQSTSQKTEECESFCTTTTRPEPEHGMYWDVTPEDDNSLQNTTGQILSKVSLKNASEQGSILPGQFCCPECHNRFSYKCEYIRHQLQEHPMSEKKFYCRTCRMFIGKPCEKNERVCKHFNRKKSGTPPYTCSYCGKITGSPEQLTAHIRNCRIISRTNLSFYN